VQASVTQQTCGVRNPGQDGQNYKETFAMQSVVPHRHFASLVAMLFALAGMVQAAPLPPTTGLQAWYKADAGVTVTGSGVSQWEDQTANNNDATQGTDGARPALSSAAMPIGGAAKPVITYGSASGYDQLNLPNVDQATGGGSTVYFVINHDADDGQGINKNWMNRSAGPAVYGNPNGAGASAVGVFDNSWIGDNWHAESSGITGWKVVRASWVNGASGNLETYMTNFTTSASAIEAASGPLTTGNWISIGYMGYPGDQYTLASFAEILIYNRALTLAEDTQALTYLNSRYFTFIPEPASALLVGLAAAGALLRRRRG